MTADTSTTSLISDFSQRSQIIEVENALFSSRQRLQVIENLENTALLVSDLAQMVTDYVVGNENAFGAAEWKKYFGIDVGPEPVLPQEFWKFWYGPDPIDAKKKVYETHLPPVLRPNFVKNIEETVSENEGVSKNKDVASKRKKSVSANVSEAYSIAMLEQLVKNPQKEGYPKFASVTKPLYKAHKKKAAGTPCWLVMRTGVFSRGIRQVDQVKSLKELNQNTGADYELDPSLLDLATVLFTRHVFTGECHLGDSSGAEGKETWVPCKETIKVAAVDTHYPLLMGAFGQTGLYFQIHDYGARSDVGLALLRKFSPKA